MNYELAKALKDAGFPFRHGVGDDGKVFVADNLLPYKLPALEELIEACGERRKSDLGTEDKFVLWFNGAGWCAGYFTYGDDLYIDDYPEHEEGKTPIEAVARLWLALNKNI